MCNVGPNNIGKPHDGTIGMHTALWIHPCITHGCVVVWASGISVVKIAIVPPSIEWIVY